MLGKSKAAVAMLLLASAAPVLAVPPRLRCEG